MSHRRRMFGTALGAFLAGGIAVGVAMGVAGALPATDGGIALGALLVFPLFFRVVFGFFIVAVIFRFARGRGQWAMGGPPRAERWGDPRVRFDDWHEHAHAETGADDQNARSEDDSRR